MAKEEIDNLTMEQYLALTQGNQAPGMVKPEIGGNVNFEIKSQFMRELKEDTFSRKKNDDTHEQDLLKKVFIQRYCPASKTAKQLEEIRNFKQEGEETLYQAWERYNDLLYKCPTHDINNHQKWHDGSSSRNIESSRNSEGIVAIVNKLENLGRDIKKLKENVHAIQAGYQTCERAHLDKDCPLNEEVKGIDEVKYEEFGRPFPNIRYDGRFNKGGHDLPSSGEKRPNLTKVINKYMEEVSKRQAEQNEWLKKFYQSTEASRETHDKIIQGLKGKVKH
ncbi:protein kinase-like domain, concanavalin A-like lectin/glucanase domain protein [Tanacetum coccineum]